MTSKPEVLRLLPRQQRGHVIPATSFCWKAGEGSTESPSVPGKVLKPPEITREVGLHKASSPPGCILELIPLHEQLASRAAGEPAASLTGVNTAARTSSGDGPHWSPCPRDRAGTHAVSDGSLRKTNGVRQRRREIQVLEGLRPGGVPEEAILFPEALSYWGVRVGNGGVCLVEAPWCYSWWYVGAWLGRTGPRNPTLGSRTHLEERPLLSSPCQGGTTLPLPWR